MAARIHVKDGPVFVVDEPFEDVDRAYRDALAVNGVFRITNGRGKVHLVNAAHVTYIENLTSDAERTEAAAAAQVQ